MIFDDVVKLIPKIWLAQEHNAHVDAITALFMKLWIQPIIYRLVKYPLQIILSTVYLLPGL